MKITKTQLQKIIKEARMAEYGYQDAAAGRPPSKVGRKDTEYMAAYEDEKENQISSREEKFGDALSAMGEGGLNEVTQGEMEFQPLEDARRAYLEDKNDDTRHELGNMINKLVEPILAKMGFFWQAESYYGGGQIVFEAFDPRVDVTIDPIGAMGRYDVGIHPMDEKLKFSPVEMSVNTMKGALQFISDTLGEQGMVGEPEAQAELPLGRRGLSRLPKWRRTAKEHKVRITKSQLQQVIREEIQKEAHEGGEGVHDIHNMPPDEPVEPSGNPKEDTLRKIVAQSTAARVDGRMLDLFSAGAIVGVLDGLNPKNKEIYLQWPIERMRSFAFGK